MHPQKSAKSNARADNAITLRNFTRFYYAFSGIYDFLPNAKSHVFNEFGRHVFCQIMKLKIGVMGGAAYEHSKENLEKAGAVGKAIAENGCILFYGATIGLPLAAAKAAKQAGALVIGVSPAVNEKEHVEKYKYPTDACDAVVFTGHGFQGRNVVLVRSCDAVVIIGGRVGTMSEFSVAYAEQKPIGVLRGSGRFADKVAELDREVLQGEMPTPIVIESDPKRLVEKLLMALGRRQ